MSKLLASRQKFLSLPNRLPKKMENGGSLDMLMRLLGIIIVFAAVGCESLSSTHQTSKGNLSGPPPFKLTSLIGSENQISDHSYQMVIPDATGTGLSPHKSETDPFPTVYFPFDSWEITPDIQDRLDATANWMNRFKGYGLTIEGHTDIRGTESYNMVLGARRAKAIQEYLANLGIPRKRLDVVSYGKTLVLCEVDDERNCHQFNRRADLLLE
jgi:outer membrane protein OmpA-like peptidoglycan-associated protein